MRQIEEPHSHPLTRRVVKLLFKKKLGTNICAHKIYRME